MHLIAKTKTNLTKKNRIQIVVLVGSFDL